MEQKQVRSFTCEDDWTWNEEDEIPLFDTGEVPGEMKTMDRFQN